MFLFSDGLFLIRKLSLISDKNFIFMSQNGKVFKS